MTRTRYPFLYREALSTEKYRRYINIIIIIILFIIIIIIIIIIILLLFYWCLVQTGAKLSTKKNEPYASVFSWFRIQLSFAILRTVHSCVRGARYPFKSRKVSEDFTFAVAGLHLHS